MIAHMIADVTPYRHFRGQAKEALEFYRDVFGLDLTLMTYGESGFAEQAGGSEWSSDWIMHGELRDAGRKVLFGADVPRSASSSRVTILSSHLPEALTPAPRLRVNGRRFRRAPRSICR